MTLRLILVGLVTSMGLELPSHRDVSCWVESGRAWANARVCDLTSCGVEVLPAPAAESAGQPAEADLAFQAVQGEMAAEFRSDAILAAAEVQALDADSDAPSDVTLVEVTVGLPEGEELASASSVDPATEATSTASIEMTAEEDEEDAPPRVDRLASAVRLTREAAQAWAAVMQEPADEAGSSR